MEVRKNCQSRFALALCAGHNISSSFSFDASCGQGGHQLRLILQLIMNSINGKCILLSSVNCFVLWLVSDVKQPDNALWLPGNSKWHNSVTPCTDLTGLGIIGDTHYAVLCGFFVSPSTALIYGSWFWMLYLKSWHVTWLGARYLQRTQRQTQAWVSHHGSSAIAQVVHC